jgi:hypothetical protein
MDTIDIKEEKKELKEQDVSDSPNTKTVTLTSKVPDINDQNELDYNEEEEESGDHKQTTIKKENINKNENDSDGEIKTDSDSNSDNNEDDGEIVENKKKPTEEEEEEDEEDGEINDGEKIKKTFIPKLMCKYYQVRISN